MLVAGGHPLADATRCPRRPRRPPPAAAAAGPALRRVLDRAARTVGITLRAQAEIDGVRLLATLAVDGYGAAIVPATAVPPVRRPYGASTGARARAPAAGVAFAHRRPAPPRAAPGGSR